MEMKHPNLSNQIGLPSIKALSVRSEEDIDVATQYEHGLSIYLMHLERILKAVVE